MKTGFSRYELADRVLDALPKIGYRTATEVQHKVIPLIIQKKNLIVEAATGTGKTAAYGLPFLSKIDFNKRTTQFLVITPSRELALQVEEALRSFCTHELLRIGALYGGMSLQESEKIVRSAPHVLVTVPGRLKDVLRTGKYDFFWRDIKYLVIDEADKLLEFGFQGILDKLVSNVRNMVQVALFSATISEDVESLIRERFYPLMTIRLSAKRVLKNIKFHYIMVDGGQKHRYLAGLIRDKKLKQGLIFCSKREEVYELANFLRSVGRRAEAYHGLLDQVERAAVMKRFKNKQIEFLVATDLAARGLDVQNLPSVINFSFPDDLEVYLHRCGRTGRAGKKGSVYNLVASKKEEIIVQSFQKKVEIKVVQLEVKPIRKEEIALVDDRLIKVHINRGKRDKIGSGDVVGFLVNIAGVAAKQIGTIAVYDSYLLVDMPESAFEVLGMQEALKLKGKAIKASRYTLANQKQKSKAVKKKQFGARDKKENLANRTRRENREKRK
ncbi:MAG TPA: DEAD/DEAH box helicase [Bacteroidetes bacterium]|nr:DEAD/DEAH box helicase [Bacteroidota bacterium]